MPDRLRRLALPALVVVLAAVVAVGVLTASAPAPDRGDAIAARLRCPVCQGTSVADSPSDTARAMRDRIDQLIASGASDEEVYDHFVGRYGTWILLEPPVTPTTWALWALPAAALLGGVAIVARQARRRDRRADRLDERRRALVADALAESGFEDSEELP